MVVVDQLGIGDVLRPFVRIIINCLRRRASDMGLNALVDHLNHIRDKYLPYDSRFIFGLDEVQRATRLYHYSFVSSNNDRVFQSIIREISKVFTKSPIKLVVSGTDLPLAGPEEAMAPAVSKPAGAIILFHKLGMFDTWLKMEPFLECYVPASISKCCWALRFHVCNKDK